MSGDDSAERSLSGVTQWFDCQGPAAAVASAWFESYSIECRMVNPEGFGLVTGTAKGWRSVGVKGRDCGAVRFDPM